MGDNFQQACEYTMQNEGGVSNNPDDEGGFTKFGITLPLLSTYLNRQATSIDMTNLTEFDARAIYRKYFWESLYCDQLPLPIAIAIFDTAVNKGQRMAVKLAQICLYTSAANSQVIEDGIVGPVTILMLQKTDVEMFIYNFIGALLSSQIDICLKDATQLIFLKGWAKRATRLFLLLESK